jgi:hypothetical protein
VSKVGVVLARRHSSTDCDMEVATDRWAIATEIRKADRSRASGPPVPGEHKDVRTARPTENISVEAPSAHGSWNK